MIDERELREMLERRAGTISATPTDAPKAIRRARRRLILNAAVGTLVGLVVLAGALAGVWAIQTAPTPAAPPTPTPIPATLGSLAYGVDGDIYVADWDGSNAVRIADGRPADSCGGLEEFWGEGPIWSPDGRYLAYRQTDCEAPAAEWWDVVISDREGDVIASFPGDGWQISWSPDSTRVAVWVRWAEAIGVYGLDGQRQALLTVPPELLRGGDHDPEWSPDGESLFVVGDVVVPIDGSTPHRPLFDGLAAWVSYSPDGSRVAYTTRKSVVVAEADGSNPQEVFGWAAFNVWSPSGDRIAFVSNAFVSNGQLHVLDVATGRVTVLVESAGSDFLSVIDFSPEGDRIFFSRTEDKGSGESSLWSVNTDGSDLRRLVTGTAWGDWLSPSQIG